jgi:hypothetical protein
MLIVVWIAAYLCGAVAFSVSCTARGNVTKTEKILEKLQVRTICRLPHLLISAAFVCGLIGLIVCVLIWFVFLECETCVLLCQRRKAIDPRILALQPLSVMVMDEAAQLAEAYWPIALLPTIERVFMIGDPQQLPAVVQSHALKQRGYHRSIFERFFSQGWPSALLSIQYRMHPTIAAFSNEQFYQCRIVNDVSVTTRPHLKWQAAPAASGPAAAQSVGRRGCAVVVASIEPPVAEKQR